MSIEWEALEFEHKPKTSDWFWSFWIISLGAIIILLLSKNFSFAILILIASFTVSLQTTKKPKNVNFKIDPKGLTIEDKKYFYERLDSFCYHKTKIIIKTKNALEKYIIVMLPSHEEKREEIRAFLSEHLKEKEDDEPVIHKLAKYI